MTQEIPLQHQEKRIGKLYGRALQNFDSVGEFQLALSNAMDERPYDWEKDELENTLEIFIEANVSVNPPSYNKYYRDIS